MNTKQFIAASGFALVGLISSAYAQVPNSSTPNTTPNATQRSQMDTIAKYRQTETGSDKNALQHNQMGSDKNGSDMSNPAMPPGRDDRTNESLQQTQPKTQTQAGKPNQPVAPGNVNTVPQTQRTQTNTTNTTTTG